MLTSFNVAQAEETKALGRNLESMLMPPLRILHLEDEARDAELIQTILEDAEILCDVRRVDNEADFANALELSGFDLILADYTLPSFDGISALKLAKEIAPEVPFIFVSATLGEELAIEALQRGATDYVFKTRLSRIVPSVRRAIGEATERAQRRAAEHTLRESEAYLAEAQRLSQTGSWAWDPVSGDMRYWSEECYIVLGFDPLGPLPRFEEFLKQIHSEDRSRIEEQFEKAVLEKADFESDYRIVHPSAGIREIHAIAHAVLSSTGEVVQFVGTVIDITEQKRAEEELQQLVDCVPQIIVVLTPEGKWIRANRVAREYIGFTLDEAQIADMVGKAIHSDDVKKMRTARQNGLSGRVPFEVEARLLGKDGVFRWFLFRYNPLIKQGSVIRWFGTATEIQSQKEEAARIRREIVRLEERTRIAQEFHDTFLQTFLSASLQLGVALDGVPEDSPVKSLLDRVLGLMGQGIEQGRNALQGLRVSDSRPVDLIVALSGIRQEFPNRSGIEFRAISSGEQRPLKVPVQHEVYRIGREALINAFRHSQARCIDLELEYGDDALCMRIRDDGCGIDCQTLETGRDRHWGLAGMRERAEKIGGQLKISTTATSGTEILLFIPGRNAFRQSAA